MNFTFDPDAVEFKSELPKAADAVMIGGGVLGVTAALYLRRKGLTVALVEKGHVGAEQSGRNWGWVRVQGRDPHEIPIALEARRLWAALDRDTGGSTGLRRMSTTYLPRTASELASYARWLDLAKPHDLDTRLLDAAETAALLPKARRRWPGALHTPSDLCAEPWVAVPQIARVAAREGVAIREGCAARGLDMQAGRVHGVVTEHGTIRADTVILAGGAWSALFLRRHGVSIPQLSVRANVIAARMAPDLPEGGVVETGWALRRRSDGAHVMAPSGHNDLFIGPDAFRALRAYWPAIRRKREFDYHLKALGPKGFPDSWGTRRRWPDGEETPFERMRVLDPAPHHRRLNRGLARINAVFPGAGPIEELRRWAGMIDVLPDLVPIVDQVPDLPGLTLATGMSGHGFGIGPAFGRIAADLATGDPAGHDLSRFRFSRFRDRTPLDLGPAI